MGSAVALDNHHLISANGGDNLSAALSDNVIRTFEVGVSPGKAIAHEG